ncbi:MAG: aminotransferase class V-fold PLP-dependent enzyme [Polyangiaceae bacterium]
MSPVLAPETAHTAKLGDRSLFPHLSFPVFANHAGISAPSIAVTEAATRVYADYERRGTTAFLTWLLQRNRTKEKLARLIGAPKAADIALGQNTTRGVTDIALCIPWKKGDRVICFEGEFPSNVTPWQRAAALFDVEVVFLSAAEYRADMASALDRLAREIERGARVVAVSAVQFQTGYRMPLAEMAKLAHARGAEVFVDAVQACGMTPIDVVAEDIDYLAAGSHKWMMGVEGCGFLYAKPECAAALRPAVAGWLSHEDGLGFLFDGEGHLRYDRPLKKSIDLIEGGNTNAAGFAALEASIDLILQLGVPSIFAHAQAYHDVLEPALIERGFTSLRSPETARRSGTLGVKPPPGVSVVKVQHDLQDRGVACAVPDGVLRFSPHWPNDAAREIPLILQHIDDILR